MDILDITNVWKIWYNAIEWALHEFPYYQATNEIHLHVVQYTCTVHDHDHVQISLNTAGDSAKASRERMLQWILFVLGQIYM